MNSSSPSFSISEPSNIRYCVYPLLTIYCRHLFPGPSVLYCIVLYCTVLYCTVPLPGPQWPCSLCTKVLSSDQGQEAARCSSVSSPGLASQHWLTLHWSGDILAWPRPRPTAPVGCCSASSRGCGTWHA